MIDKEEYCLKNTQRLYSLWDQRYKTRRQNTNIFLGNVDGYEYKKINNSEYIILKNPSRIQKKVNNIQQANETKNSNQKKKKVENVVIEFKQEDFNFQKIYPQQVVSYLNKKMEIINVDQGTNLLNVKYTNGTKLKQIEEIQQFSQQIHTIIINKVPICRYHSLFVPWINGKSFIVKQNIVQIMKLQQKIIIDAIPLVLNILHMYDNIVVGYNSVGAAASVNNLHFHMFFKDYWIGDYQPMILSLIQHPKTIKHNIFHTQSLQISTFIAQYIQGFQINLLTNLNNKQEVSIIYTIINRLIQMNIPHNILFFKKPSYTKILVFPRKFQIQGTRFACMEYSGVFCLDYQQTNKQIIQQKYLSMKLEQQQFHKLTHIVKDQINIQPHKQSINTKNV